MRHRNLVWGLWLLVVLIGATVIFGIWGGQRAGNSLAKARTTQLSSASSYIYYTLKQSTGFVLARASRGASGQPLGDPQQVAQFGDGFGLAESDGVLAMQLSPDGLYLAIDGNRDHGEQVWVYDIQHMALNLVPANVMGNFLHWMPGAQSHTFLYRPMFPMGPAALNGGNSWNPGLWEVDAATGTYKNIDVSVPAAFIVDAAASPAGTHIIYSTSIGLGMGCDVWLMNSDGSGRTQLWHTDAGTQAIAGFFTWSPDGKNIAYERLSDSPTPFLLAGLWVMDAQGGQQRRLADADGGHGFAPAWSPDGRSIAFVARTNVSDHLADNDVQALQSAVDVVDVASGHVTLVASSVQTGMQMNVNPQWSADGTSITFVAFNAINYVLGGSPRYWSARLADAAAAANSTQSIAPSLTPISPVIEHVVATS